MTVSTASRSGGSFFGGLWRKMVRRKVISGDVLSTNMSRDLTTLDVTLIGIGQMAGGGAFVVLGTAAYYAGPAVIISFAIGAITAYLTGCCYAEFAATVPRAGSGYLFSYVTLGEFVAFFVGWQVILMQFVNTASLASAISGAIDALTEETISNWTLVNVRWSDSQALAPYPDFVAFGVCLLCLTVLFCGAKSSVTSSNILNVIEVVVILFCIVTGFVFADISNWTYEGFMPNGFTGVMKGASASFYAFIGFESIASSGEETQDPRRTIPFALFASLGIMTVLYLLQSAALTLMIPYDKVDPESAFPEAFNSIGYPTIAAIIAVGIIIGLVGGLIGGIYSTSRITYAMAQDGLIFECLGWVNKRTQTPLFSEILFGVISALLALILDLEMLVEFLNVGTLLTYTVVSGCSIILHYQPRVILYEAGTDTEDPNANFLHSGEDNEEQLLAGTLKPKFAFLNFLEFGYTGVVIDLAVVFFALFTGLGFTVFAYDPTAVEEGTWWAVLLLVLFALGMVSSYLVIIAHRKRRLNLPYEIPSVPLIPALSIFLNVMLLSNLSPLTWLRFLIYLALGILIYFTYGIRYSKLNENSTAVFSAETSLSGDNDSPKEHILEADERTPLIART